MQLTIKHFHTVDIYIYMGLLFLCRDNDTSRISHFKKQKAMVAAPSRAPSTGHDPGPGPAARMIGLDPRNRLNTRLGCIISSTKTRKY